MEAPNVNLALVDIGDYKIERQGVWLTLTQTHAPRGFFLVALGLPTAFSGQLASILQIIGHPQNAYWSRECEIAKDKNSFLGEDKC